MKFTLSITLLCIAIQQAGLVQAGTGINNDASISLLSKRSTDHILEQHDIRRRHHAKKDTLRKRGACPARNAASSGGSVPVREAAGKPEASTADEQPAPAPTSTAAASSSAPPAPAPAPTVTKAAEPKPKPVEEQPKPKPEEPKPEEPKPEPKPDPKPEPQPQHNSGSADATLGPVTAFPGTQEGIGSWFRTHASTDSTNGESWCQTQYKDDWKCFAPSLKAMMGNFGYNYEAAAKAYCGREVKVTNPNNGNSIIGYICDAFDDRWVLSPGSIDLTIGAFTELYGSFDNNKNTVIKGVEWSFTGGVVKQGTFKDSEKQW